MGPRTYDVPVSKILALTGPDWTVAVSLLLHQLYIQEIKQKEQSKESLKNLFPSIFIDKLFCSDRHKKTTAALSDSLE